ncbi:hypothetical protein JCM10450v2_001629 [Rhodotorula kratochvilovae]
MPPTRPLLQSAAAAAAPRTPRRRVRPSSSSLTTTLLPPSRDLIGPPCPLSNLRPVYYAPLFPSLHTAPPGGAGAAHPYSLSEFPTSSPSSSSSSARQARLQRLKRSLASADLAWRLTRYRLDAFNQGFWARQNTAFLRARDAYLARASSADGEGEAYPPGPSAALRLGKGEDVDLAEFYAEYLERTRAEYAEYNTQLWRMQAALLWPAVKAAGRKWRWRWEVWRAGGESE